MDKVLSWLDSEPVATRVGPVVLLIVGYLLTKGTVDQDTTDLVLGIVAAILGVGGVAAARGAVIPIASLAVPEPPPETGDGPSNARHAG